MIPTNVTHGPYYAPEAYRERYGRPDLPPDVENFFAAMLNLDDNIGRLLDFLDHAGLAENTIVVFMTDNGVTMGYNILLPEMRHFNAGMKGMKTQLMEGGHRVPLFVRWPGGDFRMPSDVDGLAQAQDLTPTLLDLAGVEAPPEASFDGISLAPVLRGEQAELPDRKLVVQFQRKRRIDKFDACVMWGPWRLVNAVDVVPGASAERREEVMERRRNDWEIKLELYHIEYDPHQDNDVSAVYPEVVDAMKAHYEQWWESVQREIEREQRIHVGNDAENPIRLDASSWDEVYFTSKGLVLEGARRSGTWRVWVDEPGTYRFSLRRWPKETGVPIAGSAVYERHDPGKLEAREVGTALPITGARLKIDGMMDDRAPVGPTETEAVFEVDLEPGPAAIKTWFLNEDGRWLCGAYYLEVERL